MARSGVPSSPGHRRAGALASCALASCVLASCIPAHAPPMRSAGKVMALGGVAGIVGAALATNLTAHAYEMMVGFEVISAIGIVSYAYAELTWPRVRYIEETLEHKHLRWAKILTERAAGAAREGRCARVRRLEVRVQRYDRVTHDLVFMKDPEILRCLGQSAAPGAPGAPGAPASGQPEPSELPTAPPLPGGPLPSEPPPSEPPPLPEQSPESPVPEVAPPPSGR